MWLNTPITCYHIWERGIQDTALNVDHRNIRVSCNDVNHAAGHFSCPKGSLRVQREGRTLTSSEWLYWYLRLLCESRIAEQSLVIHKEYVPNSCNVDSHRYMYVA